MSPSKPLSIQRSLFLISFLLMIIKLFAWYITQSVAILSDALESTVNVAAALMGLYSLSLAARPSDKNHPYGHGKVEFISAGVEGTLILTAGLLIVYKAVLKFSLETPVTSLESGIWLVILAGIINYGFGKYTVAVGKKERSLALQASGKHLLSDAYTTVGLIAGLVAMYATGWYILDAVAAIIFAFIILKTGWGIIREAVAGIMDESDEALLKELSEYLQDNRKPEWVDIHNMRIIKYGSVLHVDCHLTLPWYINIKEAHRHLEELENIISLKFGSRIEVFIHTDFCMDACCVLCNHQKCEYRQASFKKYVEWDILNMTSNYKHRL